METSPGESKEEQRTAAPAPGTRGLRVRAWGGAGLSVWALAPERERRVGETEIRILGPAMGMALAAMTWIVAGRGAGTVVAFLLGYPVAMLLLGAWRLRSREEKRDTMLLLGAEALRFEGNGERVEIRFTRIVAFHASDTPGGGAVRVTLRLADGDPVHIEAARPEAATIVEALDARLPSALAGTGLRPALARRGRSIAEWRAALQNLSGIGGYRGGSLPVDQLLSAVGDDRLSAEERIGAALALGGRSAPQHLAKPRIAAGEVRTTGLRIAVDHALDGSIDEADLARAVEEEASLPARTHQR